MAKIFLLSLSGGLARHSNWETLFNRQHVRASDSAACCVKTNKSNKIETALCTEMTKCFRLYDRTRNYNSGRGWVFLPNISEETETCQNRPIRCWRFDVTDLVSEACATSICPLEIISPSTYDLAYNTSVVRERRRRAIGQTGQTCCLPDSTQPIAFKWLIGGTTRPWCGRSGRAQRHRELDKTVMT